MKLSIIIPVLDEEKKLPGTLGALQSLRHLGHEIIVVDGGSVDNSLMLAGEAADHVIMSDPGRAVQMNKGAAVATGDAFLFLHADTVLPEDAAHLISAIDDDLFWGYFDIRLSGQKMIFRLIEWLINFRSTKSSIATGDQAIFIERKLFARTGGYPEIPLMEDVAISRLLRDITAPVCLKSQVLTSSRRWEDNGIIFTVLLMWKLRFFYYLGVSPERLSRSYR